MPASRPLEERFWEKVLKETHISSPHVDTPCWVWTAPLTENGYGHIGSNGKNLRSNRVAWELQFGNIPDGMHVLHKCDNRRCVRGNHLFLGTHQQNMEDMVLKNRHNPGNPIGEEVGTSKLLEQQILEIRNDQSSTNKELADKFGMSVTSIWKIKNNRTWRHLKLTESAKMRKKRKLTKDEISSVISMFSGGMSHQKISDQLGVSRSYITVTLRRQRANRI